MQWQQCDDIYAYMHIRSYMHQTKYSIIIQSLHIVTLLPLVSQQNSIYLNIWDLKNKKLQSVH